jgi:hypothetical protein
MSQTWTAHAQPSSNNYVILSNNKWVAAIQFNGEFMDARQAEYANQMAAARELLESLDEMLSIYPYIECSTTIKARAASAKAKGLPPPII